MASVATMLDRLHMLPPEAVPDEHMVEQWMADHRIGNAERACVSQPAVSSVAVTNLDVANSLRLVIAAIPQSHKPAPSHERQRDERAHDAYFHVYRVDEDAVSVFVRMAFSARLIFLEEIDEAPVTIGRSLLEDVDRALADLTVCLYRNWPHGMRYVSKWETRGTSIRPMTRWIRGHQIFAALSQGLIFSFQSMKHAIRAGRWEEVRQWADLSISLLRGSGAAFVLTGNFSAEEYLNIVRPSMMPPACTISLSGLMSSDHRFLVQTIRDLKPALKALHEQERERHDSLQQELSTVYDRHIHVCERFVGERPSLLTERQAKKSGPALIEQFKTLRMKPFESSAHAVRLSRGPVTAISAMPLADRCPFAKQSRSSEQLQSKEYQEEL